MSERDLPAQAPELGPAIDVALEEETVSLLIRGDASGARRRHQPGRPADTADAERRPLGGTGGSGSGGAG